MERTRESVSQAACLLLLILRFAHTIEHRPRFNRSPEKIEAPFGDEVTLECEMNVKPDNFRWRHFLLNSPYNSGPIPIETGLAIEVPHSLYKNYEKRSRLTFRLNDTRATGDYQCLVTYGVSVLASVLGRITLANIGEFPHKSETMHVVTPGNTVLIHCDLPPSNPAAIIQYYKSKVPIRNANVTPNGSLLLQNVSNSDSATYTCSAKNPLTTETKISYQKIILTVDTKNTFPVLPKFLVPPTSNYTVKLGELVFLECSAVGNPPPTVVWRKLNGDFPSDRSTMMPGGMRIDSTTREDEGTYSCSFGELQHHITVLIEEKPTVHNLSEIKVEEGQDYEVKCTATGSPEPAISWWINGRSVQNDSNIEAVGNILYFRPVEKRHAGMYQCFAHNKIGSDFAYSLLTVFPKQIPSTGEAASSVRRPTPSPSTKHKRKKPIRKNSKRGPGSIAVMVPPSKPNVTRLSDESVMVRWSVPDNEGLPIQFFKVQYRELGPASPHEREEHPKPSRWKTTNADIIPHLRNYQVDNLKPDHIYRFRIAAVYSNNDNKNGPNSAKFHLRREDFLAKNPLPAPRLTKTEPLGPTSIAIYWEYTPDPAVPIEGFYVNFQPASTAGDYFKATVDGERARSYIIHHLQPDTSYDIKLQSYTTAGVSDFSPIMKQKTLTDESVTSENPEPPKEEKPNQKPPTTNEDSSKQLYLVVGAAVAGLGVLACGILAWLALAARRRRDKPAAAEFGGSKHRPVANGRGVTITTNPLADAEDHQNQNVIEMACLSNNLNSSPGNNNRLPPHPTGAVPLSTASTAASSGDNYV